MKKHGCEGFIGSERCGKPAVGVIQKGGKEWKVCKTCRGGSTFIRKL